MTDQCPGEEGSDHENAPERGGDEQASATRAESPEDCIQGAPDCEDAGVDDDHVEELPDGAGCTEIWEHLSERRAEDD